MVTGWQFWIDRGGTFTDVVIRAPDGQITSEKLLSQNADLYADAATFAIERWQEPQHGKGEAAAISTVQMGTTVATNALLERKGDRTLLVTNAGLRDAFLIGQQHRTHLFDMKPARPVPLYEAVSTVSARMDAFGHCVTPLDLDEARGVLETAYNEGFRAVAIVLLHAHINPADEKAVAALAQEIGYTQVSVGSEISATAKIIPRGDTTIADAYLSPVLFRYIRHIESALKGIPLSFMQSSGRLTDASRFKGHGAILSGPAGGIIAAAQIGEMNNTSKLITFDMGGTSTDVALYKGEIERVTDSVVAGTRLSVPMMDIHTVAAGGGSICSFEAGQLRVGPASAGADPGPACYGRGGPLTVTDCNLLLGNLQPDFFPHVFGENGDKPLDREAARAALMSLYGDLDVAAQAPETPDALALGLLDIAVETMARAIRRISVARGHDARHYSLFTFGGAGGQHACKVADALGMEEVIIPPWSGVLSALGMGLANHGAVRDQATNCSIDDSEALDQAFAKALAAAQNALNPGEHSTAQTPEVIEIKRVKVRYEGSDTLLTIPFATPDQMKQDASDAHKTLFGILPGIDSLIADHVEVELIQPNAVTIETDEGPSEEAEPTAYANLFSDGTWSKAPLFARSTLKTGQQIHGPALIIEDGATTRIEAGWVAVRKDTASLSLKRTQKRDHMLGDTGYDPVRLAVFNNLFMALAEEMGSVLAQTATSVNMKERLDYSCALFDHTGRLIANAPHMPVHLGSMGESVRAVLSSFGQNITEGDGFLVNDPNAGGTHLPDITVVTPYFVGHEKDPRFFLASRGHHADVGGIMPGSMPAFSKHLSEEGIVFEPIRILKNDHLDETTLLTRLRMGPWPARNPAQNIADIRAQFAANARGHQRLTDMIDLYGLDVVTAYMGHIQTNAARAVAGLISRLRSGSATGFLDNGARVCVTLDINTNHGRARLDFTGTSPAAADNYNAPVAVTRAAVLYAMRLMTGEDIPLNDGCLDPVDIVVPAGTLLNPPKGAAIVGGNVETSQVVVNTVLRAAGVCAASQGTMNNLTFGTDAYQYYETLGGGSGATAEMDGTNAIQCHMTNSRLTDIEILEQRYPVRVTEFAVRTGSGGKGTHVGGDGLIREIEFLEPMDVSLLANDYQAGPLGLAGGTDGRPGEAWHLKQNGETASLSGRAQITVKAGDKIRIETPGGGGYGTL